MNDTFFYNINNIFICFQKDFCPGADPDEVKAKLVEMKAVHPGSRYLMQTVDYFWQRAEDAKVCMQYQKARTRRDHQQVGGGRGASKAREDAMPSQSKKRASSSDTCRDWGVDVAVKPLSAPAAAAGGATNAADDALSLRPSSSKPHGSATDPGSHAVDLSVLVTAKASHTSRLPAAHAGYNTRHSGHCAAYHCSCKRSGKGRRRKPKPYRSASSYLESLPYVAKDDSSRQAAAPSRTESDAAEESAEAPKAASPVGGASPSLDTYAGDGVVKSTSKKKIKSGRKRSASTNKSTHHPAGDVSSAAEKKIKSGGKHSDGTLKLTDHHHHPAGDGASPTPSKMIKIKSGKKHSDGSKLTYQDYLDARSSVDRGEFQGSRAEEQRLLAESGVTDSEAEKQASASRKRRLSGEEKEEEEEQEDAVEVVEVEMSPPRQRKRVS